MQSLNRSYLCPSKLWNERRFSSSIFLLSLGDNHATLPQNWKKTPSLPHVSFIRFVSLFIVACILLPTTGTWIVLQNEIRVAKQHAQAILSKRVEKKQIVLLKFSTAEHKTKLRWEHAKEFEYRGNMYDVIESKVVGDTTYYSCWWDREETEAKNRITAFNGIISGKKNTSHETILHLFLYLKTLFFSEKITVFPRHFSTNNSIIYWKRSLYKSYSFSPPSPPPEPV